MKLLQILGYCESHRPLESPAFTSEACFVDGNIFAAIEKSNMPLDRKILAVESGLLKLWKFGKDWQTYLDSSLISHMDAILALKKIYDGAIGIKEGGLPYADLFKMAGVTVGTIDYSYHRRKMKVPEMTGEDLERMKNNRNVLLVDVDIVSGKTIREAAKYLLLNGVNVTGAYVGLSRWPGLDLNVPCLCEDEINFDNFWKQCGSIRQLKIKSPYKLGIVPQGFRIFTSNGRVERNDWSTYSAARKIGRFFNNDFANNRR